MLLAQSLVLKQITLMWSWRALKGSLGPGEDTLHIRDIGLLAEHKEDHFIILSHFHSWPETCINY